MTQVPDATLISASRAIKSRGSLSAAFRDCQVCARSRSDIEMKNLEAKFRLADLVRAESRATAIGYTRRAILNQRDTFFRVAREALIPSVRQAGPRRAWAFARAGDYRTGRRADRTSVWCSPDHSTDYAIA